MNWSIAGVVIGLIAVLVTLFVYYSDIKKKLSYLIEHSPKLLTPSQANALTDLYLGAIQSKLRVAIRDYIEGKFSRHVDDRDVDGARTTVYNTADAVISNMRNSIVMFQIPKGSTGVQNFKEFLDELNPINASIVSKAKEESLKVFRIYIEGDKKDPDRIANAIAVIVEGAGRESEKLIKEELRKRYAVT